MAFGHSNVVNKQLLSLERQSILIVEELALAPLLVLGHLNDVSIDYFIILN